MQPRKVDGPGPGAYKLPSGIKNGRPKTYEASKTTTFGSCARNFINLPKDTPAPSAYHPVQNRESVPSYSFPKAIDNVQNQIDKESKLPGPGFYQNMKEMANQGHLAKSILGGSKGTTKAETDGGIGPAGYTIFPQHSIPGFVIKEDTSKSKKEYSKDTVPVGPQTYNPVNPNHAKSKHLRTDKGFTSIGNS